MTISTPLSKSDVPPVPLSLEDKDREGNSTQPPEAFLQEPASHNPIDIHQSPALNPLWRSTPQYVASRGTHDKPRESDRELTLEKIDDILNEKRPVLIDIAATWCEPCKELNKELTKVSALVGDQIEIVRITDDTNPEAAELYQRLGFQNSGTYPTVLLLRNGEVELFLDGFGSADEILQLLHEKAGVEFDSRQIRIQRVQQERGVSAAVAQKATGLYGKAVHFVLSYFEKVEPDSLEALEREETSERLTKRNVFERMVSANPVIILGAYPAYLSEPWGKEILEKSVRGTLKQKHFIILMSYFRLYRNEPYGEEILAAVFDAVPDSVGKFLKAYEDPELILRVSNQVSKKSRITLQKALFTYLKTQYNVEDATRMLAAMTDENLRELAVNGEFSLLLEALPLYQDKPYAKGILLLIAANHPDEVLAGAEKWKELPYAEEIWLKLVQKKGGLLLNEYDEFKDKPYADTILQKALDIDPMAVLHADTLYNDRPDFPELLDRAGRHAIDHPEDSQGVLINFRKYFKDKPYAEELLEKTVKAESKRDHSALFSSAGLFRDKRYAGPILMREARKDPKGAFDHFHDYRSVSYASQVVRAAADEMPALALTSYDQIKDQPWAKALLEKSAKKVLATYPTLILLYADLFQGQSYAEAVITEAFRNRPASNKQTEITRSGGRIENLSYPEYRRPDRGRLGHAIEAARNLPGVSSILPGVQEFVEHQWVPYNYAAVRALGARLILDNFEKTIGNAPYAEEVRKKALFTAAEHKDTVYLVFQHSSERDPYKNELLEKAARFAAEYQPIDAMLNFRTYQDLPFADEAIEKAIHNYMRNDDFSNVHVVFENDSFPLYKNKPFMEKVLTTIGERSIYTVLQYYPKFRDTPYAQRVLDKAIADAIRKKSSAILYFFDFFKDRPDARQLLDGTIEAELEQYPSGILQRYAVIKDRYSSQEVQGNHFAQEILDKAVAKTVERGRREGKDSTEWFTLFTYASIYRDRPYGATVLREAVMNRLKAEAYVPLIRDFETYEGEPYAEQVLEKSVRALAANNARDIVFLYPQYKDRPYAKEIYYAALRKIKD